MPLCDTMSEKIERFQRLGFEHDPLMHRAYTKTAGEVVGRHPMGTKASNRRFRLRAAGRRLPWHKIKHFSSSAAQSLAHGVKAVNNDKIVCRTPECRPGGRLGALGPGAPDAAPGQCASLWPGGLA